MITPDVTTTAGTKAPPKLLNKDLLLEVDSDTSSQKSITLSDDLKDGALTTRIVGGISNIKKIDDVGSSLEKEDKVRVNAVRT